MSLCYSAAELPCGPAMREVILENEPAASTAVCHPIFNLEATQELLLVVSNHISNWLWGKIVDHDEGHSRVSFPKQPGNLSQQPGLIPDNIKNPKGSKMKRKYEHVCKDKGSQPG